MDFPCRGERAIVRRRVYARGSAAGRKRRTAAAHATVTRVHVVHGTAATAGVIVLPIAAGGYVSCARSEVPQDVAIVAMCVVTAALAAGCAASLQEQHASRYCSVATYVPCLVQQRTVDCQPCPGQN